MPSDYAKGGKEPSDYALKFYTVRKNDTWESIAERCDVPVAVLRTLNKDKLGKIIMVPHGSIVREIAEQMREVSGLRAKLSTPAPVAPPSTHTEKAKPSERATERPASPEPKPKRKPTHKPQRRGFNPWASLASMIGDD